MNRIASIRRALTWWLFARGEHEVSTFEVILWWEKRRFPYNLIVGVAGLFTCAVTVAVAVIASAGTIQLDRSCWLRLLPQELRCSLVTGLQSARASLSPCLAKESATPSLSSQLNRSGSDKFGEPLSLPDPPIFAVLAVIAYGVGANICYTGGWISEVMVRKIWQERTGAFGPIAFTLGIVFSFLITLAPAALFSVLLIVRLLLR